jgi:WD40 repeat protein
VLIWDIRSGQKPSLKVEDIHSDDINCVDWNRHDENLLLTGSSDFTVSIVDIRNCKSIKYFDQHSSSVNYVKWSPFKENVFASAGSTLMIWDLNSEGSELIFNHLFHSGPIVDIDWNFADEWTLLSTSDD